MTATLALTSSLSRAAAAYDLGVIGEEALPALLAMLTGKKVIDRRATALALGKIGSAEVFADLRAALEDGDPVVRRFTAEALGKAGRRAA